MGNLQTNRAETKPVVHFVYCGDPRQDSVIHSPLTITNRFYRFLERRANVCYYDLRDTKTPVDVGPADIVIGHPCPDPNTAIKRLFENKCAGRFLMFPFHSRIPEINRYAKDLAARADKLFLISGPYWTETIDKTEYADWKEKIVRIDNAVDSKTFPLLKKSFNSCGKRGLFVFGRSGPEKGTRQLFELLSGTDYPLVVAGEYADADIAVLGGRPNTRILGMIDWRNPQTTATILQTCDFFVNASVSDASPTTLLESMALGLIPVTTIECGYYYDSMIRLCLDKPKYNLQLLQRIQQLPQQHLAELQGENRRIIETVHSWENFCGAIWKEIWPLMETAWKPRLKVAQDYVRDGAMIDTASEFAAEIEAIFKKTRPRKIIETGTYRGRGTTTIIAKAMRRNGIEGKFYSIEVNPKFHAQAREYIEQNKLPVIARLGLSVPRSLLPSLEEIEKATVKGTAGDDIFVDHPQEVRAQRYFAETNFADVPDNLLEECLSEFDYAPDFVLLDSAGCMGRIEFEYLISLLKKPCIIALDDILHIKHHESFGIIQKDSRFETLVMSKEKFGFCIAKFTPAVSTVLPQSVGHILWLRPDSIGDAVLSASMLPYIRRLCPEAKITVVCQEQTAELYRYCPEINGVFTFDYKRLRQDQTYRQSVFDQVGRLGADCVLHSVYSRCAVMDELALATGSKIRIAMQGDCCNITPRQKEITDKFYTTLIPSAGSWRPELCRHSDFLAALGCRADGLEPCLWLSRRETDFVQRWFDGEGLEGDKTIVLFAGAQSRQRFYDEYGKALAGLCKEFGLAVIAAGAKNDFDINQKCLNDIAAVGARTVNLCGRLSLLQTAAVISYCRLAIGAETGLAHIAAAAGVPNVILLGGGHFSRFAPYSPLTTAVSLPLDCYRCNWKCSYPTAFCIAGILPETLEKAVRDSLNSKSEKPRLYLQGDIGFAGGPQWKEPAPEGVCVVNVDRPSDTMPKKNDACLVSAIVSTYNSERFIAGCLQDLVEQALYQKGQLEIIVVDSGSQENERAIAEWYQNRYGHIKYIRTEQRETVYAAWNRAIQVAGGKYITNANTDDRHCPDMLERLALMLDAEPDAATVYSHFYVTNIPNQTWQTKTPQRLADWHPEFSRDALLKACFTGPQPMWRRSLHDEYGLFDDSLKVAGDYEFFLRVSQTHRFILNKEPLGLYYYDPSSLERSAGTKEQEDAWVRRLYLSGQGRIIRRPFDPESDERFSLPTETPQAGSWDEALRCFGQAHRQFKMGNMVSARRLMDRYYEMRDYAQLKVEHGPGRKSSPLFSVVIVTYNKPADVKSCIESLRQQECNDYEIIVVDNGDAGGKACELSGQVDVYIDCPVNFYPAEARNIGAHFARGGILVFVDDDAAVGADYLSSIRQAFEDYEVLGLRGRILPEDADKCSTRTTIYDLGERPFATFADIEGNSAFRRDAYLAVGGMDALLFGHEGIDLSYRLIRRYDNPSAVIYWPDAVVYHDYGDASQAGAKKKRYSGIWNYLLYKHDVNVQPVRTIAKREPLRPNGSGRLLPALPAQKEQAAAVKKTQASAGPKVSVVMSCFNSAGFLRECMDSILSQTLKEWELLIADDGSTDDTRAILSRYAARDGRIRLFLFDDNKGPYVRRNYAIEQARSGYIVIQDADDIMVPEKLEILFDEIEKDQRFGIVGSFYGRFMERFDGSGFADRMEKRVSDDEIMRAFKSSWHLCWHGSAIIRKSLFETIGMYDRQRWGSDTFWLSKAGLYGYLTGKVRFKNLPEVLTYKREHDQSQTGRILPADPRGRRCRLEAYYLSKLAAIQDMVKRRPGADVSGLLKQCHCSEFVQRFGGMFEKWESEPLTEQMILGLLGRGLEHFVDGKYVSSLITLNSLALICPGAEERYAGFDLLRGLSWYAAGRDEMSRQCLQKEADRHGTACAGVFEQRYLAGGGGAEKLSAQQRRANVEQFVFEPTQTQAPVCRCTADGRRFRPVEISVVVSGCGDKGLLRQVLADWGGQNTRSFELLVLGRAWDGFAEEDFGGIDFDVAVFSVGSDVNIGAAFNAIVRQCRGEVVVFADAGLLVGAGFLNELAEKIKGGAAAVRGRIIGSNGRQMPAEYDLGQQAMYSAADTDLLWACRKDRLLETGGFSEGIWRYVGLEWSWRHYLAEGAGPVLYCPQLLGRVRQGGGLRADGYLLRGLVYEQVCQNGADEKDFCNFVRFAESHYRICRDLWVKSADAAAEISRFFEGRCDEISLFWADRAKELSPQSVGVCYQLGRALHRCRRHGRAQQVFEEILRMPFAAAALDGEKSARGGLAEHAELSECVLDCCVRLADCYSMQGRVGQAQGVYEYLQSNKSLMNHFNISGLIQKSLEAGTDGLGGIRLMRRITEKKRVQRKRFVPMSI